MLTSYHRKRRISIEISAGSITEAVTITAEAGEQLQTENANVSRAISTQEVQQLPQNGRDPYELVRLTPGVFGDGARGGNGTSISGWIRNRLQPHTCRAIE